MQVNKFLLQLFYHDNCDNCCKCCKDSKVLNNYIKSKDNENCIEFENN